MFLRNYRKLYEALQKELQTSRHEMQRTKNTNEALNSQVEHYKNIIVSLTESVSVGDNFEIDFKKLNAFSIERVLPINQNTNFNVLPVQFHENTAIGYIVGGEVKEWYFSCNMSTHQRLVLEFKAYRNGG